MAKRKTTSLNVKILLDRSGSMGSMWRDAIGGLKTYIEGLPKGTDIAIKTFDTINASYSVQPNNISNIRGVVGLGYYNPVKVAYELVYSGKSENFETNTFDNIKPRGGTPLLDATAFILDEALAENVIKTVIVVMTDGGENSSKIWQYQGVAEKIKRCEDRGWQVLYLGANFAGISDEGTKVGLDPSKFMEVSQHNFADTYSTLSSATVAYASGAVRGIDFSDELKAAAVKK